MMVLIINKIKKIMTSKGKIVKIKMDETMWLKYYEYKFKYNDKHIKNI